MVNLEKDKPPGMSSTVIPDLSGVRGTQLSTSGTWTGGSAFFFWVSRYFLTSSSGVKTYMYMDVYGNKEDTKSNQKQLQCEKANVPILRWNQPFSELTHICSSRTWITCHNWWKHEFVSQEENPEAEWANQQFLLYAICRPPNSLVTIKNKVRSLFMFFKYIIQ